MVSFLSVKSHSSMSTHICKLSPSLLICVITIKKSLEYKSKYILGNFIESNLYFTSHSVFKSNDSFVFP